MTGYQDLREFERGVIVGAREMGHNITEVAMECGFSRTTISRVYHEYRTNDDIRESLSDTDVQPFCKLLQILMLDHQQMSPCEPFNETSSKWAFSAKGPLIYPC
ncbi:uncharacterized protein TNCV_3673821 [Trichonephila clavipes]|nr:uncharacterized protein TNCV_3673821 [Trichonephila clavipes]